MENNMCNLMMQSVEENQGLRHFKNEYLKDAGSGESGILGKAAKRRRRAHQRARRTRIHKVNQRLESGKSFFMEGIQSQKSRSKAFAIKEEESWFFPHF